MTTSGDAMAMAAPAGGAGRHAALIIQNAIDYAIVGLDLDGIVTSWNEGARRIMGWPEDEAIGRSIEMVFTPEDRAAGIAQAEMRAAAAHGRGNDERWHLRRDGTRFWANGEMMPLRGETGVVEGYVKILRDRTEQRDAFAALAAEEDRSRALNATLHGSEVRLRQLLDTIAEGFYAVDREGVTTTCNAAFLRMMGFADEREAIGRKLHDVIHHSHPDGARYDVDDCPIYTAARRGTSAHVPEEQFFPIHGPPLWVEYWATPILRDGELEGAICTFLDIGERKRAEDARLAAERRRQALLELSDRLRNMDDPAAMAELPAAIIGRTLGIGAAGYGRIDASGRTLTIGRAWAAPDQPGITGDHALRDYGAFVDDLLAGEMVVIADVAADPRTAGHVDSLTARAVRALVNVPLVEMGRLAALFCVVAPAPRAWADAEIAFIRDVAERTRGEIERRRAEQALRDLAATLQQKVADRTRERDQIWRVSRDMLGVADADGVWLSVNPAWTETLGWPVDAIIGKTSDWLDHPDDRARTRAEVGRLASGLPTTAFENRLRARDGSYHDVSWTAVPVDGLLYCVGRDVTEKKRQQAAFLKTEEQLRQSQKVEAVGQLTGGVAHDFNNLLTVIRGSIDLLRRPDISDARRLRYLDAIAGTADRATRLTSQLLAFARRQALRPEIFDAADSVAALADMIGTLAGPRVRIAIEAADCPCFVNADRSQFDTAIVNMAVNARDAMAGEGTLTISAGTASGMPALRSHPAVPGEFVTVTIADSGSGVAADTIDRIFEPFFTTKGVGEGTGLGLSQVFGFAKQSGGDIRVESIEGEGSVFTLYLPLAHAEQASVEHAAPPSAATIGSGACILVVEDNPDVGSFARQALAELGYDTVLAVDGPSALAALAADGERFDVVFSDVVMPGMSGIELGQQIRRLYPRLPVILTSGYSSVLAADGTDGFELLRKPYSLDELSRTLGKVAAWRSPETV